MSQHTMKINKKQSNPCEADKKSSFLTVQCCDVLQEAGGMCKIQARLSVVQNKGASSYPHSKLGR